MRQQWEKTMREWQKVDIENEVFSTLESLEGKSLRSRMEEMRRSLHLQETKENDLQMRFANLKSEKEKLQKMIEALKK